MSLTVPATTAADDETAVAGRSALRLHRLTMVPEDDGVMIGRPDTGSYALFPAEGAEALCEIEAGRPLAEVVAGYEKRSGETLDVADFLEILTDLGFVLDDGEERPPDTPVRWQGLGRWLFSPLAWLLYTTCVVVAVLAMVRTPVLRPSYRSLFFTDRITVIPIAFTVLAIPPILVHECFHALAGRRLGLPSSFGVGRRLYFLVAETRLDSLLSVPRRRRYLPFLAGMLADVVLLCALTLAAAAIRSAGGPHWLWGIGLAAAFTCTLRLLWQFQFYLQTDLYFLASAVLRCSDLQGAGQHQARVWRARLLRQAPPEPAMEFSDHDRRVARWYAPAMLAGYGFALGSLLWAGLPTTLRLWSTVVHRLTRSGVSTGDRIDTVVFLILTGSQMGLLAYVTVRDRRAARRGSAPAPAAALEGEPS